MQWILASMAVSIGRGEYRPGDPVIIRLDQIESAFPEDTVSKGVIKINTTSGDSFVVMLEFQEFREILRGNTQFVEIDRRQDK